MFTRNSAPPLSDQTSGRHLRLAWIQCGRECTLIVMPTAPVCETLGARLAEIAVQPPAQVPEVAAAKTRTDLDDVMPNDPHSDKSKRLGTSPRVEPTAPVQVGRASGPAALGRIRQRSFQRSAPQWAS